MQMDICFLLFLVLPGLLTSVNGSAFSTKQISYVKSHNVLKGTCIDDIKGLTAIQTGFRLESWNSDPCTGLLPLYWIRCSSDPSPRVTALDLGSLGLTGSFPDFSSMKALTTIDFSSNKITGQVPSLITSFPNLTLLNLENNDFSGTLPPALLALSSENKLAIVTIGNPKMHVHGRSRYKTSLIAEAPTTTRKFGELSPSGLPTADGPTTTGPTTTVPGVDTQTKPLPTPSTPTQPQPRPATGGGFFTIRHRKKKKKSAASGAATVVTVTIEPGTATTTQLKK